METISMHQNMGFSVVWARLEDVADALEYLPQCEKWTLDGAYGRPHPPLTKNFLTYGYVADVARLGSCGLDLETEVVGVLPLHDRYVVYRVANDGRLHPVEVPTYEDAIGVANEWFNCYEVGGTEGMEDPTSLVASVGTDAILRREREGTIAQQVERHRLREITGPWMEEEPAALRLLRPDAYRFNDQYLTVETSDPHFCGRGVHGDRVRGGCEPELLQPDTGHHVAFRWGPVGGGSPANRGRRTTGVQPSASAH